MNAEHPDEITLLRLAFPRDGVNVSAYWAHHVLHCPQCSADILNMREMAAIFEDLKEESQETPVNHRINIPLTPYVSSESGSLSDMPAAAFTGLDSDMSEGLSAVAFELAGLDEDALPDVASWLDSESEEPGLEADAGAQDEQTYDGE